MTGPSVARISKEGALVDIEIEIDRVERDDRSELRLVGLNEIAGRDPAPVDAAGDGRADLGIIEIEFGRRNRGLGAVDLRHRGEIFAATVVEGRDGNIPGFRKLLGAFELSLGETDLRFSDRKLRLCLR